MPELAEVETLRKQIIQQLKNEKITDVQVDASDKYLYAHVEAKQVKKALGGAKVMGAGRKGKYFWLELDRKPWPIFHLGMSGDLKFDSKNPLKHSRLSFRTSSGTTVVFNDPRRFGRMWLTDDPWKHSQIKKLGYDPLLDFPSAKVLGEKLLKRRRSIKAVLLDQSLFAGVGNWLADEILYQARISPHQLASALKVPQIKSLHAQTLNVVKKAVRVAANHDKFPPSWIFHHRWGRMKNAKTTRGAIIHETVGGRTTAWVPTWQK